jgi:hypothetical protein
MTIQLIITKIKTIVIVPMFGYTTNYEFWGVKDNGSTVCSYNEADLQGNFEFNCDQTLVRLEIKRTGGGQIALASIGLLISDCDCSLASYHRLNY